MRIDGASAHRSIQHGPRSAERPHGRASAADAGVPVAASEPKGVVSKLGTGHFNPVAELRLRLNHLTPAAAAALPEVDGSSVSGRGFQRALDAYSAAIATVTVPPSTDSDVVASPDIEPIVEPDPAPVDEPSDPADPADPAA